MQPQKNSGNRGAKRDSGLSSKNHRFIQDLFHDLRNEGTIDDVFVGRVIKKLGNGRMEVFYIEDDTAKQTQSLIRGSFRGRGKRSVWIDVGSFVVIAKTGVGGSLAFEIMGVLTSSQMKDLEDENLIDSRVAHPESATKTQEGFEFDHEEVDVDNI